MWEQRYGVPVPGRAASGYRVYTPDDVELLRRAVVAPRARAVGAGGARPGADAGRRDRPPVDLRRDRRADVPVKPQVLRKRTLIAISHAIEDETIARAAGPGGVRRVPARAQLPPRGAPLPAAWPSAPTPPWCSPTSRPRAARRRAGRDPDPAGRGAGQRVGGDRRRARLRRVRARVGAPADAGEERELPELDRRFESLWTMDPAIVRRAALVGCALTRARRPELGGADRAAPRGPAAGGRGARAGADRADQPARRLPGGLRRRADADRADRVGVAQAERLRGAEGEVEAHLRR